MTIESPPETTDLGFDPEVLRAKYREERDKRLRPEGNEQYIEIKDQFAHYIEDPYVEPGFSRDPIVDEIDVVVIGGGFGGLLAAARLREAGVGGIRIIEKGGDFGGTWYWNRYPGAMCDVESYIYMPLLEELNYVPTEKYVHAPEILKHSRAIGEHYDLYRNACFQTEVTELRWDDETSQWIVSTNRGDEIKARFVCMPTGPLNRPKLPGIQGIESYKGHSFHTSRWDYGYTGGDSNGNLTGLAGKRIGVIGTGATAVQCVPHLAEAAEHLYVFQRTPSSIDVRANRPTDPEWAASLGPGWHKHRMDNFNILVSGGFQEEDLVSDGWTDIIRNLLILVRQSDGDAPVDMPSLMKTMETADFQKMEQIRARVDSIIEDASTAEALKPYYRQFCKRPCFHDEYLQTYNRPHVTLVDTDGKGVERITEKGIVANGVEYEVDCIVYATGFEVGTAYTRRSGFEIHGRNGITLTEKWADGVRTMHGLHSHGFPNCYIMGPQQSGFTVNFPHMLDEQARHIAHIVRHAMDNGIEALEVTEEAENEWVENVIAMARFGREFLESCTPGYYNNEGMVSELAVQNGFYGGGSIAFFNILKDWREEGSLRGLYSRQRSD
ncbi:MAG TPA: NAD(P)/FAD-dependent oxidoreductase [Actinomycetota bacterium]|jgi:cyclohexanone monooxygenase|nr:NAD(P)/FAD-dependent oxidoreductase [Actinomycetota bacterium]